MLSKSEFRKRFFDYLRDFHKGEFTVREQIIAKAEGSKTGIVFDMGKHGRISPVFYLDNLYEQYSTSTKSVKDIAEDCVNYTKVNTPATDMIGESNNDIINNLKTTWKERVLICPLPYGKDGEDYKTFDIAPGIKGYLRYYFENDPAYTIAFTKELWTMLDITEDIDTIKRYAIDNYLRDAILISSLDSIMASMMLGTKLPEDQIEFPLYIGNKHGAVGAAGTALIPQVLKYICDKFDVDDIYIIPSSTDEILILENEGQDIELLKRMIKSVNNDGKLVEKEKILSYSVFSFNRKEGKVIEH